MQNKKSAQSRQSLLGFSGWNDIPLEIIEGKPQDTFKDTLTLEYPALKSQIIQALQNGADRNELRKRLIESEHLARLQHDWGEVDKFLGRTSQTYQDLQAAARNEQYKPYIEIMKNKITPEKIIDLVNTGIYSGIAPGFLLANYDNKTLIKAAEERAGERLNAFKQVLAWFGNSLSNVLRGMSENNRRNSAMTKYKENDLLLMPEWYGAEYFMTPEQLEEEAKAIRNSTIKISDWLADLEEATANKLYTNVRPPDSAIGQMFKSAIENGGFTMKSAAISGLAWYLGGPIGGVISALYNTADESGIEAGGVFMEQMRRMTAQGIPVEKAIPEALERSNGVFRNNMMLLPTTNYLGDYLFHGAGNVIAGIAGNLIPGGNALSNFARGAFRIGIPITMSQLTEGMEEWAQEYFQMSALGDKIDSSRLRAAFKMGYVDAILYSLVGLGTRAGANRLFNRQGIQEQKAIEMLKSDPDVKAVFNGLDNNKSIEENLAQIVKEEPIVFIPKSKLDEQTRNALGITETSLEDENGNIVEAQQDESVKSQEEQEIEDKEEIAIRKSTWEEFIKNNPEKAQELNNDIREGVQGVTRAELLNRKILEARKFVQQSSKETQQQVERIKLEFFKVMPNEELAETFAYFVGTMANNIVETYGSKISPENITNVVIRTGKELISRNVEQYTQLIGEWGAEALDKAEGTTRRMDNLEIAKQMEAAGKDYKTIWWATNWNRGTEGSWRYEIMDGKLLTKELRNFVKNKTTGLKIPDIFDAPELYTAYPEIANMSLKYEDLGEYAGYYDSKKEEIVLDINDIAHDARETRKTLVHEIQHAIQELEGFARGASPETFKGREDEFKDLNLEDNSADGLYDHVAGEVESRANESSVNWGEERRKKIPPQDREEYPRNQQIILGNSAGDRMIMTRKGDNQTAHNADDAEAQRQLDVVRKQYEGTEQWLKAPNGKKSNLNEQQWLQVRTPNFKRWFGNWNYDENTQVKVTNITDAARDFGFKTVKDLKRWLIDRYKGQSVVIDDDGTIVEFTVKGLKDSFKGLHQEGKVSSYAALEELIKSAQYFDFEGNDDQKKHEHLKGQDVYYSAMQLGEKFYSVRFKFDIAKGNLSRTYKDHKIAEVKISPVSNNTQTQSRTSGTTYKTTGDNISFTLSDLTNGVKPENVSKAVDENGEPTKEIVDSYNNQVKSATDSRGTFDAGNYEIYNQTAPSRKNYSALNFKKAFQELKQEHQDDYFIEIYDLRRKLSWPREVFDQMLRVLRDKGVIALRVGDVSMLTQEEAKDLFFDENGSRWELVTWENDITDDELVQIEVEGNKEKTEYSALEFKKVFDELHTSRNFVRTHDIRRKLSWPRGVFDQMLRDLRDRGVIDLRAGDNSLLTRDEVADSFIDENGFSMGSVTWGEELSEAELAEIKTTPQQQNEYSALEFKEAFDKVRRGKFFVEIYKVRRSLNWPREVFDKMLTNLRDREVISLRVGDASMLTREEAQDCFVDENGSRMELVTWNNELSKTKLATIKTTPQVAQAQEATQQEQHTAPSEKVGTIEEAEEAEQEETQETTQSEGTFTTEEDFLAEEVERYQNSSIEEREKIKKTYEDTERESEGSAKRIAIELLKRFNEFDATQKNQQEQEQHEPKFNLSQEQLDELFEDEEPEDLICTEQEQEEPYRYEETNIEEENSNQEQELEQPIYQGRVYWPAGANSNQSAAIMELFSHANASTPFHELAHIILRVMSDFANLDGASDLLKNDVEVIFANAGITWEDFYSNRNDAKKIAQEYFAESFEKYLAEGNAPTKELASVFERIKDWLIEVYNSIKDSVQLNDDMRDIFDRLLAAPDQLAKQKSMTKLDAIDEAADPEIQYTQEEIERIEAELKENEQREALINEMQDYNFEAIPQKSLNAVEDYIKSQEDLEQAEELLEAGVQGPRKLKVDRTLRLAAQKELISQLGVPLMEVNNNTFNALLHIGGIDEQGNYSLENGIKLARNYLDQRKRYLNKLNEGLTKSLPVKNARTLASQSEINKLENERKELRNSLNRKDTKLSELKQKNIKFRIEDINKQLEKLRDERKGPQAIYNQTKQDIEKNSAELQEIQSYSDILKRLENADAETQSNYSQSQSNGDEVITLHEAIVLGYQQAERYGLAGYEEGREVQRQVDKTLIQNKEIALRNELNSNRQQAEQRHALEIERINNAHKTELEQQAQKLNEKIDNEKVRRILEVNSAKALGKMHENERVQKVREFYKDKIAQQKEKASEKNKEVRKNEREKKNARIATLRENLKLMKKRKAERKKIKTEAKKLIKKIIYMSEPNKNISWAKQQEIKELISNFEIKRSSIKQRINKNITEASEEFLGGMGDALTFFKNINSISNMNFVEVKDLHDKVKDLYDIGRREEAARKLLSQERREEMYKKLAETLKTAWDKRQRGASRHVGENNKEYKGIRGRLSKINDWIMSNTQSAQRFFDWLDGNKKYTGDWVKYFVDYANKAYDNEIRHKFERYLNLETAMQNFGITPKILAQTRNVKIPHHGDRAWTVQELMGVYAALKNEKSRQAILYGNFAEAESFEQAEQWAAEAVQALHDNERAFADFIIQEYDTHFDRINNELIRVYNQGMNREKNYTPMYRIEINRNTWGVSDPDAAEILLKSRQQREGIASINRGFSKSRQNISAKNQIGVDLNIVSNWYAQVEIEEHAAAFAELVGDLRNVLFGNNDNREASIYKMIKQTHGKYAAQKIKSYFNLLATSDTLNCYDALDGLAKVMARNMSIAYLCGNVGTVFKQFGSYFLALPYAGPTASFNAWAQAMRNPNAFMEECFKLDPQLRNRKNDPYIKEIRNNDGGYYDAVLDFGMKAIGWMDRFASSIVFKATYDANIRKGLSHEDAVKEGQRVVLLTQPATHLKDKPLIGQQSGYTRLVMMFTNQLMQTFGEEYHDLMGSLRRGEVPEVLYRVAGLTLAAMWIKALTGGLPDEPDDTEEWINWVASAFTEQAINTIPVIGKHALTLWDYHRGFFNSEDPFLSPFARIIAGTNNLLEGDTEQAIYKISEGSALLVPLPVIGVRRIWQAGKELKEGELSSAIGRFLGVRRKERKRRRDIYINSSR